MRFAHRTLGQRVVLEPGGAAAAVLAELDRLAPRAVMVVGGQRQGALLAALAGRTALRWTEVTQHVPVALADRARAAAAEHDVDVVVAIGGGSAIGLAKAVALDRPVRIVAVPTTYAGSEATNVWGLTDAAGKRTGTDDRVLPETVVYDPALVASLPPALAAASALNAVAHCVDSFWGPAADPIDAALAGEGLRALAAGLRDGDPAGLQYGCYLAAVAFASAGSGLHHKICHVLGGRFDLPHAATHAIVLPYVLAFNAPAAPGAVARIGTALGVRDAVAGVRELNRHAPRALREIGLAEADLPAAVAAVLPVVPPSNPRPVDAAALHRLLLAAWAGDDPEEVA
ncbi:MAG TPA: iron-containing alcohol dehydrogenase [Mycobacteriales bacterium]|nr:iron-containing alcohol dehydrogenase [Mycobacteriales bacterium]